MIWIQTQGLFLDAYRELNAKKMFWIVLGLTLLVLTGFALLGVNSDGFSILWYTVPGSAAAGPFIYKTIFSYVVVGVWFTWIATLLALISTAGIIPDFLAAGSVDLYLSRPISRWRLFLTKFSAGLLFVALQVTVFSALSFFILGIRANIWQPGLFLAIPIVLLFFSYLFALCVLFGVLTRSTVAALLLTLLAWFVIWGVDKVDVIVVGQINQTNMLHDEYTEQVDALDRRIAATQPGGTQGAATPPAAADDNDMPPEMFGRSWPTGNLVAARDAAARQRDMYVVSQSVYTFDNVVVGIKTFLPKTRETINLLDRFLFTDKDLQEAARHDEPSSQPETPRIARQRARNQRMLSTWIDPTRGRSIWWVLGTSIAFEIVVVGFAGWLFTRRDY